MQYLAARAIPGLLNICTLVVFTRLLSPRDFGEYALTIAGAGILNIILFQWLTHSLLRFGGRDSNSWAAIRRSIRWAYLVGLAVTLLIAASIFFLPSDNRLPRLLSVGLMLFGAQAWFEIDTAVSRVDLNPRMYGIQSAIKALLALLLGAALITFGSGSLGAIAGLAIAYALATLVGIRRRWGAVPWRGDLRESWKTIIGYGTPLAFALTLGAVVTTSDRFLLAWILGTSAAGAYSAGYDLAHQSLGLLLAVVHLAAFPLVLNAARIDAAAARKQIEQNAGLLAVVGFPAMTGLVVMAPAISGIFFDGEFAVAAVQVMPIVAVAVFLSGVRVAHLEVPFHLHRKTRSLLWVALVAAGTNITFNILWIPEYGIVGAAYATLLAYATSLLLTWFVGRRQFNLPLPLAQVTKVALASMAMALSIWHFRATGEPLVLAAAIAAGIACYLTIGLLLNVLHIRDVLFRQDKRIFRQPFRRNS